MLRRLIDAGMDVARLNFSHRGADHLKPLVGRIRKVAEELGVSIGILGDLRGPRIRVGEMQNGAIELQKESLDAVEAARVRLDEIRARRPESA